MTNHQVIYLNFYPSGEYRKLKDIFSNHSNVCWKYCTVSCAVESANKLSQFPKLIYNINDFMFSGNDHNSCLPSVACPRECACSGSIVRCSRKQLTVPPRHIPTSATEL